MQKEMLLTALLVVLVLVSATQAFQLADLNGKIESSSISTGTTKAAASSSSGSEKTSLPSNLQSLPGMVGGC
jgi:hypothetical protein